MFSLPIPRILVSLHHDNSPAVSFGERIASTLQKMGNNVSVAVDELSEELSDLLEATSIASASTRDELYSFFDDGFDDDAEEMSGTSGTRTPAIIENPRPEYFSVHMTSQLDTPQCRQRTTWTAGREYRHVPTPVDEGYVSSESENMEMGLGDEAEEEEVEEEEEREALLPAKRFSWRASSPERCSLLYWEK